MAVEPEHSYDWQPVRDYCASIGMRVDEPGLQMADAEAAKYGLTQEQFDASLRLHAWRMKFFFTPSNYTIVQRIMLALYFLFGLGAKS